VRGYHENTVHMKIGIRKHLDIVFSYVDQIINVEEAQGRQVEREDSAAVRLEVKEHGM
jgi:hypothetical protein